MELLNAIVHKLVKARNAKGATVVAAKTEAVRNEPLDTLIENVLGSYNSRCSRYAGSFEGDVENYRFSVSLGDFLQEKADFLQFSITAMERLRIKVAEVMFASGGYLLFVRYKHDDREMFLVAKLNPERGAIFSEDLIKVIESQYLNVDHLQVAARVDLTAWRKNEESYLTFVLKQEQGSPSDYFREFVGCRINQDAKTESKKLVAVVLAFAAGLVDKRTITEEQLPEVQRRAYDYAESLRHADPPGVLEFRALANVVWPDEPAAFLAFLNQHPDPPSAGFMPDRAAFKKLTNISYKSRELTIKMTYQFKQDHLHVKGKDVIIKDAPERLISEIVDT